MKKIIKEIYNEVEKRCMADTNAYGIGAWDHHIKTVYEIATSICEEYKADYNVVALSALLHDIASVTDKELTEEHHIHGVKIAEYLLSKYDIEQDKIEHIKKCILNHRGSRLAKKNSPEEICIADADAMAHFYNVPSLLSMVYVEKGLSIDEGAKYVYDKLERSYNKLSSKGKKIIKKHYEAAKLILNQKH